jgi:hypothetical protein
MRTFDFAALRELAVLLAGREPIWISEPALAPGVIFWLWPLLPRVFVAPDVLVALNDAVAIEHVVRARRARAVERAAAGRAWVRS